MVKVPRQSLYSPVKTEKVVSPCSQFRNNIWAPRDEFDWKIYHVVLGADYHYHAISGKEVTWSRTGSWPFISNYIPLSAVIISHAPHSNAWLETRWRQPSPASQPASPNYPHRRECDNSGNWLNKENLRALHKTLCCPSFSLFFYRE